MKKCSSGNILEPERDLVACRVRAVLGAADSGWNLQMNGPGVGGWRTGEDQSCPDGVPRLI